MVVNEEVVCLLLAKLLERIGPQDIAHKPMSGRLPESVNLVHVSDCQHSCRDISYALQVLQRVELGAQTAMYTQELLVHNRSERQCAERLHTGFVNGLAILVLALQLKGEVVSQMSTLMISSKQPERVWIPDLQGPEVQDALPQSAKSAKSAGRICGG